jgi:Mg2+/Co2+ transporter CorB
MDNKETFLKALQSHGINVDNIYVERAGNFQLGSSAKNKKVIFRKYLRSGAYNRIRFFDDDMNNIRSFLSLAKEYPNIEFNAYHVSKDGSTKTIRR